jgi:tetratricopeptide (TPR) repeat protein
MYESRLTPVFQGAAAVVVRKLVVSLAVASAAIAAKAQTPQYVPASPPTTDTVSARELQVSSKAKHEFERGLKSLANNDAQGSLKQFSAAIAAAPDYVAAYYHKGLAEMLLGRNDDAMRSFQAATELSDGHFPRAEFGYALALTREGRAAEAEPIVRHGLQAAPNIPDGHVILGVVLLELNRVDEAEQNALEALRSNELGAGKGHLVLGDVCAIRGDFAGQARELETYLDIYPKDPHRDMLRDTINTARRLAEDRSAVMPAK